MEVISILLAALGILLTLYGLFRGRVRPVLSILRALFGMKKFLRKARQNFGEKKRLGNYVANVILKDLQQSGSPPKFDDRPVKIFVESGTTTAEIGLQLLERSDSTRGIEIYTNNLLMALGCAGQGQKNCVVLPGHVDNKYPGIVGTRTTEALGTVLKECSAAVMTATYFGVATGPGANSPENRKVKEKILREAEVVYLCFTSDKLLRQTEPKVTVFGRRDWADLLEDGSRQVHILVGVPARLRLRKRRRFEDRFQDLAEALNGEYEAKDLVNHGGRVRHLSRKVLRPG